MRLSAYDDATVRLIVDALDQPAAAYRHERMQMVNDALLATLERPREEVEDQPSAVTLAPEERRRMADWGRSNPGTAQKPPPVVPVVLSTRSGRKARFFVHITLLPAADGGEPYVLCSYFEHDQPTALDAAEALVGVAAGLFLERSEAAVRARVCEDFARHHLEAFFVRLEPTGLAPVDRPGSEDLGRADYAREALSEGRPIFEGASMDDSMPLAAYLPLGHAAQELLVLRGKGLTSHQTSTLALFARQVSAAITNARLISDLERRHVETRLLLELGRTMATEPQIDRVLHLACDFLVQLLDVSNAFVMLYEEDEGLLRGAGASGAHREEFISVTLARQDPLSLAARVARERRTLWVEDTSQSVGVTRPEMVARFKEQAVLAVPMLAQDRLMGVVVVDDVRRPRRFGRPLRELAEAIAGQLALAIQVSRAREDAQRRERLAALGELAAIVAHEVRNPLGVVFNAVASLSKMLQHPSKDVVMLLDMVREEADRLDRMVGDLLDFARPRELSLLPEDVPQLLHEAVDVVRAQREPSSVVFRVSATPELPPVRLDRRQVRQALLNIVANAVQAMPNGGEVQLRAARVLRGGQAWLCLEVVDQGPGIAPEAVERIWEPFFTTKATGTGLGLAVVRRIVEDHHGHAEVESTPGVGTRFLLWFPFRS